MEKNASRFPGRDSLGDAFSAIWRSRVIRGFVWTVTLTVGGAVGTYGWRLVLWFTSVPTREEYGIMVGANNAVIKDADDRLQAVYQRMAVADQRLATDEQELWAEMVRLDAMAHHRSPSEAEDAYRLRLKEGRAPSVAAAGVARWIREAR